MIWNTQTNKKHRWLVFAFILSVAGITGCGIQLLCNEKSLKQQELSNARIYSSTGEENHPETQDADPARILFPAYVDREVQQEDGSIRYNPDHLVYISGVGEQVEVPGMEASKGEREIVNTINGYLYPTKKGGLWGYISSAGDWIIEPSWQYADPFFEEYALVMYPSRSSLKNRQFAYIDPFGEVALQWNSNERIGPIVEGMAIRYTVTNAEKTSVHIIDACGNTLASNIMIDTDSLNPELFAYEGANDCYYKETLHFSQGLLAAAQDGKYGFINRSGEWEIPPQYDYAESFSEGRAVVRINGKYGYIDLQGNIAISPCYTWARPFSEGKAAVQLNNDIDLEMAFIDQNGKILFPGGHFGEIIFSDPANEPYIFREGFCLIYDAGWTYLDKEGQVIWSDWPPPLDTTQLNGKLYEATSFHNGLAHVLDGTNSCVINTKGEIVYCFRTICENRTK